MNIAIPREDTELVFRISLTSRQLADASYEINFFNRLSEAGILSDTTKPRIELAFQEALINALEHGNLELQSIWKENFEPDGKDRYSQLRAKRLQISDYSSRIVEIELSYVKQTLVISIHDQGRGFSYKKSDSKNEQSVKLHGRGFDIIYSVVDRVEFFDQGRGIRMIKSKLS